MDESLIAIIPLPSGLLSPNCPAGSIRGRLARASLKAKQRRETTCSIMDEECNTIPWEHATVLPIFYHKERRRRDHDNAIAKLKGAYDGIVDAGVVADDDPEHMTRLLPRWEIDKANPRVELIIKRGRIE